MLGTIESFLESMQLFQVTGASGLIGYTLSTLTHTMKKSRYNHPTLSLIIVTLIRKHLPRIHMGISLI